MDKKIIFNNVSLLTKEPKKTYRRKILKNINLTLDSNLVTSIIAENTYDRFLLGKLLSQKIKPTKGEINLLGDYLTNKTTFRGEKFSYITIDELNSINGEKTVGDFLKENILRKNFVKKNYLTSLKEFEKEREELQEEYAILNDKEKLQLKLFNKKKEYIQDNKLVNFERLNNNYKYNQLIKEYNDYLFDNEYSTKNLWRKLDSEILYYKNFYKGKEKSIKNGLKLLIKDIKEIRSQERAEQRVMQYSESVDRDIENLIFIRTKRELRNLYKYLKSLNKPNLDFKRQFISSIEKAIKNDNRNVFYKELDWILKEIRKITQFSNYEISSLLEMRISYIKNVLDPRSPINSRKFNNLLHYVEEKFNKRKLYFEKVISDIELEIEKSVLMDKQEKTNLMRQAWEHKIISLKFQAQIYKERIFVIEQNRKIIDEVALLHSYETINDVYDIIFELEKTLTDVDVALNNWRYRRQISLLKLMNKIQIDELIENKKNLNKKISEYSNMLDYKGDNVEYRKNIVQNFVNNRKYRIDKYDLTTLEKDWAEKRKQSIKERLEKISAIIKELEEKLDVYNFGNKELYLTYLLDDISFDTDGLELQMGNISIAQKQRLSLVKSVLEGKQVIIIEDPKYDLDLNSKTEIVNSIKNIVSNHNVLIVLLTDDLKLATTVSDKIAFMYRGTIFENGSLKSVINNPIHPFTKWMLDGLNNKYGSLGPFEGEMLNHSIFSDFKLKEVEKNHMVFCTEEEYQKWTNK